MFRDRAIFLLVISAILIPLIFITREIMLIGIFVVLFILCQVILLYLFYLPKRASLEHWYVFWCAILSLVFMLIFVLIGKVIIIEILGLILFLIYFIGIIILLFVRRIVPSKRKPKKEPEKQEPTEEEMELFRGKDELDELVGFFEPGKKSDMEVVDIEEPKIEKIVLDEEPEVIYEEPLTDDEESTEQLRHELEEMWKNEMPQSVVFDHDEDVLEKEAEKQAILDSYEDFMEEVKEPMIKELKEAPRVNLEKVRKDLERIDVGVKTISDKIKVISEKAIMEGAERKIKEIKKAEAAKKKPKPKKAEMKVHASKTGTKYHYDKKCLGLKRVSKKNFVTYANSKEARKKKLKACDMCK